MKEHPSCQVGLQSFQKLKPFYLKRLKEWNICASKYHVEIIEL